MEENNISEEVKEERKDDLFENEQKSEVNADAPAAAPQQKESDITNVGFGLSIAALAISLFSVCMFVSCLFMKYSDQVIAEVNHNSELDITFSFSADSITYLSIMVIVAAVVAIPFAIIGLKKCFNQPGVKNLLGRIFSIVGLSVAALSLMISPLLFILQ